MYRCKSLIETERETPSSEKRLSICLRPNGFSFSEVTSSGVLLTYGEAEGEHASTMTAQMANVKAFFSEVGVRPLGYAKMELVVLSEESVWVPDDLYTPTAHREYLKLVGGKGTDLMATPCKALGATAVYAYNEAIAMGFKVALPGLAVMNQHVKLASLGLERRSQEHPLLLTHWRDGAIDFAAFRDGRYIYGNTVRYASESEAQFHTVEVLKSFGLENSGTELLMCGEVGRERFALLRPYFPQATLYTGTHTSFGNPAFKTLHTYRNALIL